MFVSETAPVAIGNQPLRVIPFWHWRIGDVRLGITDDNRGLVLADSGILFLTGVSLV
ncbi:MULTISPECIES: hypothetical protein [unclassified Microcoleus]|uniref:hypothetical protein n=1 Tax=unclassified Microcoleus TaxID=2642155 RepID=UPI001DA41C88|nr:MULTISPECIES: hypothetical protein [unclassified Microcoleus]MCC3623472.1 hypothetical protein [Microcoleus sp. PH2017_36_ELK_O_B]